MRQITSDIYMLENIGPAPAFLLVSQNGLTLIDTGMLGKTKTLFTQLEENNYALSDLQMIVLTHCHQDHTGGVATLVKRSNARIVAHQDEIPYILQKRILPASSTVKKIFRWGVDRLFSTHIDHVDMAIKDGDIIDALGGLQVIHVPGHTPGSIALYQPERKIMFCGDIIFNERTITLPPKIFNVDTAQVQEAARRLVEYPIDIACFGHGEPILKDAGDRIREAIH
jgi:glyoxylase-like metal-dependent hydrolase (beta-lactamase superfamily II)